MFEDGHTYPTKEEAHDALASRLEYRDATLESRDALLFLQISQRSSESASEAAATYKFTRIWFNDYMLDATDKPWLPLAAAAQTDAEPVYLLDSKPADGRDALPTIFLAELRASAEAVAEILKAGEGIEGYEECVSRRLAFESESMYAPLGLRPLDIDEIYRTCRR